MGEGDSNFSVVVVMLPIASQSSYWHLREIFLLISWHSVCLKSSISEYLYDTKHQALASSRTANANLPDYITFLNQISLKAELM